MSLANKTYITIVLLIFLIGSSNCLQAASRYWIGNGSNTSWNNTANWSTTSGGAGGASVPGSSDKAFYNGSGTGKCVIDATVNIGGIDVQVGFTDTIKQGTNPITIGTQNAVFSAGVFWGGSASIALNGTFTLSGSVFQSTSGTLTSANTFTKSSGTFTHNNGTLKFTTTTTITGSVTLYVLEFNAVSSDRTFTISSGTTLTVNSDFTLSGSTNIFINTGTIDAKGNVNLNNTGTASTGTTGTLQITGTSDQTINGASVSSYSRLPNVIINKSSGTLYLSDFICIKGNWTYTAGTIDAGTSTVVFSGSKTISGTHSLFNVFFTSGGIFTIASGTTLTVLGTLTIPGANDITINTGTIDAKGDITITNTVTTGGGTATIRINGTGNQTLSATGALGQGKLPKIIINKTSDTLFLSGNISSAGNWTYTAGIISAGTSTVQFCETSTLSGSIALNNVTFDATGGVSTFTIASGTIITVNGNFSRTGNSGVFINTGSIYAKGNIYVTPAVQAGGGNGTITINGTGNQSIYGSIGSIWTGRIENIIINKSSGNLYLYNQIAFTANFTYTTGNIIPGTSSVSFWGVNTLSGSVTLNNVYMASPLSGVSTLTISSGTTITAAGKLYFSGPTSLTINTGNIEAKGDIHLDNTFNGGGGSATLKINGTSDQTIDGTSLGGRNRLCNVEINKSSGTLYFTNWIVVAGNWTYTAGACNIGTSMVSFTDGQTIAGSMTFNDLEIYASTSSTTTIASSTVLTVNGKLYFDGTTNTTINTGTIEAKGDIYLSVSSTSGAGGGTALLKINGTGTQTVYGSNVVNRVRICKVIIDKSAGTLYLTDIVSFTMGIEYIQGTVDPGTSVSVIVNNPFDPEGTTGCMAFYDVYNYNNNTLSGKMVVNGALTIYAATTLTNNSHEITLKGNWINNGTYSSTGGYVIFAGTGKQTITKSSGSETFPKLKVNKPSNRLFLSSPVNVTTNFDLLKGSLITTSSYSLTLSDNITATGGADTAYVHGPIKKTGNDAFTFPLGDTTLTSGKYHPIAISAPSSATDQFEVKYYPTAQAYGTAVDDSLEEVSPSEYWTLNRTIGSSNVYATPGWNSNSPATDNTEDMCLAYWDGNKWAYTGIGAVTVSGVRGTVASGAALVNPSIMPVIIGWRPGLPFAVLTKKLDGGYYQAKNSLKFRYPEEYSDADGKLDYHIYDEGQASLIDGTATPKTIQTGDNHVVVGLSALTSGKYYTLQVKNEKGETWKLRFKKA